MAGKSIKGFSIRKEKATDGSIKTVVVRDKFYGRDASAKIAMRKSKKVRVVKKGKA